ncbi:MAG: hypothetical protein LBQ28_07740 [Prevotellaceae bacterium]|nr:hypothetical protein [Prevotellaceae bacterium]
MKKLKIKGLSAVAAIFVALLVLPFIFSANNEARAAMNMISESIDKSEDLKTMVMKYLMLTTPSENFDEIRYDADGSMIEHTATISFEGAHKWRLEKSGRTSVFDGVNSYSWVNEIGWMANGLTGFFGDFEKFLDPQNILRYEQQLAKDDGSEISMNENGNQIILTIKSKAKGDFKNDYAKNSSILESDNKRTYTFDRETKLLQALKVEILYNKKYETVFETTSILYNVSVDIDKLLARPNIEWVKLDKPLNNSLLTGIKSKEAAKLIFTALANKNIEPVKEAFIGWNMKTIELFFGLELIELGEPFKSGLYAGEYVPYKIKLANGKIKKFNIALRNDNENNVWVVDGGL